MKTTFQAAFEFKKQNSAMVKYLSHPKIRYHSTFKSDEMQHIMLAATTLYDKIRDTHFQQLITDYSQSFSAAETQLLNEILEKFPFDALQAQALVQAVLQQSRFDPNANHISNEFDDDDETTAICQHCLNPPVPPLRDYYMWRDKTA